MLAVQPFGGERLGVAEQHLGRRHHGGAVGLQRVEGARPAQGLEGALVDEAGVDAFGEVDEVAERPAGVAHLHHVAHGFQADVAHGA